MDFVKKQGLMLVICIALLIASSVQASYMPLIDTSTGQDSGWAMVLSSKMEPVVTAVSVYGITDDAVTIEIHKTFNKPIDENGYFSPIIVEFMKTSADATSQIVINDEYIQNDTGSEWSDFHMQLMVSMANPQAGFNPNVIDGDQLEAVSYATTIGYDGLPIQLNFQNTQGGGVPSSSSPPTGEELFMPAFVVGTIQINVDPDMAVGTRFALKEIPTSTPEPATVMILGLGGLAVLKRKRIKAKLS